MRLLSALPPPSSNFFHVQRQKLQQCLFMPSGIDKFTRSAQTLRNTANGTVDHRARLALAEADRHIEMCIHSCLDARGFFSLVRKRQVNC